MSVKVLCNLLNYTNIYNNQKIIIPKSLKALWLSQHP